MRAGTHGIGNLFACQHGTDGQTATQPLGQGDEIRLQAELLAGQESAGAAHAGLYFVHNNQNIVGMAVVGNALHIVGVQRNHAAFALYHLHHNSADRIIHSGLECVKIVGGDVAEVSGEGAEILVENILAGGGQGGKGAAMERVDQRQNFVAVGTIGGHTVFAGALDGTFVGFGTRVAEKHLVKPGAGAQPLGQLAAGGGVIQVGRMLQTGGLHGNGLYPGRVAVAQRVYANAGGKVQIGFAVCIIGIHALAVLQHQRAAGIGVHDVFLVTFDDFFGIHGIPSLGGLEWLAAGLFGNKPKK